MSKENIKVIYQDNNLLVIDKPAGVNSDSFPQRVHRLDKDTSGILLIAKNNQALEFLQKQFKQRKVEKKYLALINGHLKKEKGIIETLIGRSTGKIKQRVYLPYEPGGQKRREAITKYKVLQRFKDYDLIEAEPITGRKHQIRVHLSHQGHPVCGDKIYGFKSQKNPQRLIRQFLHATYIKIKIAKEKDVEFRSNLPKDLKEILEHLSP